MLFFITYPCFKMEILQQIVLITLKDNVLSLFFWRKMTLYFMEFKLISTFVLIGLSVFKGTNIFLCISFLQLQN